HSSRRSSFSRPAPPRPGRRPEMRRASAAPRRAAPSPRPRRRRPRKSRRRRRSRSRRKRRLPSRDAPGNPARRSPYVPQRHLDDFLAAHHRNQRGFPSKDDLIAFVSTQPGKVGTREIARAFGLKNADRATLKTMLRELTDDGRIERRRKKLHPAGALPAVVL